MNSVKNVKKKSIRPQEWFDIKWTPIFGMETSASRRVCGHQCDCGAWSEATLLPPFVQGKARTLFSTGDTGLTSLWLICRVQLGTNRNRSWWITVGTSFAHFDKHCLWLWMSSANRRLLLWVTSPTVSPQNLWLNSFQSTTTYCTVVMSYFNTYFKMEFFM